MAQELTLELDTMSQLVDPSKVELRSLEGREALSRPYELDLTLEVTEDGGLSDEALDDLLRMPCRVQYGRGTGVEVHGVLAWIEMLSTAAPTPVLYRARLVPRLWLASRTRRSRIFQDLDVAGIVKAVLEELGLEEDTHFAFELASSPPVSEYTVQYQETDLDFLHRLLEHAGIAYHFVQEPDGERVVFGDANEAFAPLAEHETLEYTPGEAAELAGVRELRRRLTPGPQGVMLRDYNWRTPSVGLQSEAPADRVTGRGFVAGYGDHFKTPAEGGALAAVRAQEHLATRDVYHGRCRITALRPGHRFGLMGHPVAGLDRDYLVTATEYTVDARGVEVDGGLGTDLRFTAIPFDVVYRPPRRTPKPRIAGVMHARIDGAVPGTAAPIDELGRYKVLFPFDLVGEPGGRASRWVRLAQPASGAGYGIHFPLHIGAEVAIAHVDGDPDRPIIMNSPPNAETITPVSEQNATQSQIITQTGIRLTWDDDC
ncbi:MAG TPA: type VI secretion system tip protein TssI/VgrG [Sandaracinaceae bacterium LLY-WYZ-13_1]|nr:type VI secretion system tip protein TssI/VgrG [Sandaracinaceae bacterium LLY-WYZ-13_1]